jgi:type IV secretion system protein VirB3
MRGTPAIYYKSLNRSFHILGVEKDLFFINIGLGVAIAISAKFSLFMDLIAFLFLLFGHGAGILITRSDPIMKKIYLRHIRYQKYYAPTSSLQAKSKPPKMSVPVYQFQNGKS